MNSNDIDDILMRKGVKPTSNRVLVMRELLKARRPVSLMDMEIALDTLDKTSIFRVLELFAEKDIVHTIEDGSRSLKYELCGNDSHHSIGDQHVHFYCERCKQTYCFESVGVPVIDIPEGFDARSINYMIKGICPKCRNNDASSSHE